jgi:hypothetical protein
MDQARRLLLFGAALSLAAGSTGAEIVINEIMYNTPGSPDVEYVELFNVGPDAEDLTGWYLLDDDDSHDACPLAGALAAGEYLVVAGRIDLFTAIYPSAGRLNPHEFDPESAGVGFGLGNASEEVRLFDASGSLVDRVAYTDGNPWPSVADGDGPSLELLNPLLDNALPSSWSGSTNGPPEGTPGEQNSSFIADPAPRVSGTSRDIPLPRGSDPVTVTTEATDDQPLVSVELFVDTGGGFAPRPMFDDGLQGDGAAGDSVFGSRIEALPSGTLVRYYVAATDSGAQTTTEPLGAPGVYLAYTVDHESPPLSINEILASNQTGLIDNFGDRDDWLEIRNPGPFPVELGGLFLSDDLTRSTMWQLPALTLDPGQFLLIWCDAEPGQGSNHAIFRLSREGGEVGLFDAVDHGNVLIHGLTFGPQSPDVSFGYLPDDAARPEYLVVPTPLTSNDAGSPLSMICVNELLAGSQIPNLPDWVELYNRGGLLGNISGWHLSDDANDPRRYTFPQGTIIPPGGFLSVDAGELGFGFSVDGSEVILLTAPGGLAGRDYLDFGGQFTDVSQGRLADGEAEWHFFSPASRDLSNACDAAISPLAVVTGLRFVTPTALGWDPLDGAAVYAVLRGDLDRLRATNGDFAATVERCVHYNSRDRWAWVPASPGGVGQGLYYLVRGSNLACGFGSYDAASDTQAASRDASIADAASVCP